MNIILRRKGLGYGSCKGIKKFSQKELEVVRNDRIPQDHPAEVLIRWGCSSHYPKTGNRIVINHTKAMHLVNNKTLFRKACQQGDVKIPKTYYSTDIPEEAFPVIVRPSHHSQGKRLYFAESFSELVRILEEQNLQDFYISEYIEKEFEVRVYCMSGKVIAMANKKVQDKTAIAWNHATGNSSFVNIKWGSWHLLAALEGLRAMQIPNLDFGGVDVMIKGENVYVLEVNSAPSLTSEYRQKCFAKGFDYIINEVENSGLKPYFDPPEEVNNWRDIIHPCLL